MNPIIVRTVISVTRQKAWNYFAKPEHRTNWNFASNYRHCHIATNDLRVGGRYVARMKAKDGSLGFNFEATYTVVKPHEYFSYEFAGRHATREFNEIHGQTEVVVTY